MTQPAPNYAEALIAFAEQLYGDKWQGPLSRTLGVHKNTIARVAAAVRAGHDYATAPLMLAELRAHLVDVARDMEAWTPSTALTRKEPA